MGLFITLILILLVVLATMGYHNYKLVGRISRDVSMTSLGDHAVFLGESAIEEAQWILNRDLNQPGNFIFESFRQPAITGQPIRFSIPVPEFQIIKDAYPFMEYKLKNDQVDVEILFERAFSTMPYEKYGTIRFRAEVTGRAGFGKQFRRAVEDYKEFRSALIATPRPYGQTTFYVQDITGWINPAYENKNIADSNKDITQELPKMRQRFDQRLSDIGQMASDNGIDLDVQEYINLVNTPPFANDFTMPRPFPNQAVAYSKVPKIEPMERLNLPGRITAVNTQIISQVQVVLDAQRELDQTIDDGIDTLTNVAQREGPSCVSGFPPELDEGCLADRVRNSPEAEQVRQALREASRKFGQESFNLREMHKNRLSIYVDFQSLVMLLSGSLGSKVGSFFVKYQNPQEWRNKALHIIDESAGDINQAFLQLTQRFSPLNGVVFVNNPSQTLNLSGVQIKGKLYLVSSGNLELGNVDPADPGTDLLSFLSYGRTRISGRVTGSVSVMNELDMLGAQSIVVGNLVLNRVYRPAQLKGVLEYDERIDSGKTTSGGGGNAKQHYTYIGIGPRSIAHHLDRTPIGY